MLVLLPQPHSLWFNMQIHEWNFSVSQTRIPHYTCLMQTSVAQLIQKWLKDDFFPEFPQTKPLVYCHAVELFYHNELPIRRIIFHEASIVRLSCYVDNQAFSIFQKTIYLSLQMFSSCFHSLWKMFTYSKLTFEAQRNAFLEITVQQNLCKKKIKKIKKNGPISTIILNSLLWKHAQYMKNICQ